MRVVFSRRWSFLGFLAALHLILVQGPSTELGRLLFLSHIGLGLLWQPFVHARRRLGFVGTSGVVLLTGISAYYLSWWLLACWVMVLCGVVGGKVFLFQARTERIFYLLGLGYLATIAFTIILPKALAPLGLADPLLVAPLSLMAPGIFLFMAVLPAEREEHANRAEIVDYVYGVMVFLLLAVIALGSLSFALLVKQSYLESLVMTLALVAGVLLLLGYLWNPSSGFGGLGAAVVQHIVSLGLPLEDWVDSLAQASENETDPQRFLGAVCAQLPQRLPGVAGGEWHTPEGTGQFGESVGHPVRLAYGPLRLQLVARVKPSPALLWQYQLVTRLLAEFYLGKWRAEELQRLSYVEAIHDTGARLTHDVKNLLQSLDGLCAAAAAQEGTKQSGRFNELVRRQLPEISKRLRQTLVKLSAPGMPEVRADTTSCLASDWLDGLRARYAYDWLEFESENVSPDSQIADAGIFSSVAENLLQNLVEKRHQEPGLRGRVRLANCEGRPGLVVEDNGHAIPEAVASRLFNYGTRSESGFGIGLYQSARLATHAGYRLQLAENRQGCVRFSLLPQPDQVG